MSIETDRRLCADLTEKQGPNFSLGFRTLPDAKRWAIQASYAFCRIADDLADEEGPASDPTPAEKRRALQAWREELRRVYHGVPRHPVSRALAASCGEFGIPESSFADLIDGCEADLAFTPPCGQRELEQYCDLVATSMGRICLSVFAPTDPRATLWARDLSHALQVTNILRDVREDNERGRIYLPQEWLEDAGVADSEIVPLQPRSGWYEVISRGVSFAKLRFARSLPLVRSVAPDSQLAVALMRGVYREILHQIERDPARILRERVALDSTQRSRVVNRAQALVTGAASGTA